MNKQKSKKSFGTIFFQLHLPSARWLSIFFRCSQIYWWYWSSPLTCKASFKIVYREVSEFNIFTFDEVNKYTVIWKSSFEDWNWIKKNCIIRKKVIKFFASAKIYQAGKYYIFYHDLGVKTGQKVWPKAKNITIERLSRKLDWQR